jgi:hypothetical protein
MALRPTQGDEKTALVFWKRHSPPCHPDRSAAQWRDLRFDGSLLEMFSTGEVMALRPTQGGEKRFLFSNHCRWRRRTPLCHLDRSAAKWRDLRADALSLECFSTERSAVEGPAVAVE